MKCATPTATPDRVTFVFTYDAEGRLSAAFPAGEPVPPGTASADVACIPGPYFFTGVEQAVDASIERHAARSYDPTPGCWTTPDPAACAGADPNLYRYVAE
jgi:RHS repeat-associated protein